MCCFETCLKCFLSILNSVIIIGAGTLIVFAVSLTVNVSGFYISKINLSLFVLIIGIALCIVAIIGCLGVSCIGNYYVLSAYTTLLIILVIIQVSIVVIIIVNLKNSDEGIHDSVTSFLTNAYENYVNKSSKHKTLVLTIHVGFKCCGLNGPTDNIVQLGSGIIIASCCKADLINECRVSSAYETGCLKPVEKFIKNTLIGFLVGILCLAVIELAAAVLACCIKRIKTTSNNNNDG